MGGGQRVVLGGVVRNDDEIVQELLRGDLLSDARVEIACGQFHDMLNQAKAITRRQTVKPQDYIVQLAEFTGEAKGKDGVELRAEFDVCLLSDAWAAVRLLPSTVSVSHSSIRFTRAIAVEEGEAGAETHALAVQGGAHSLVANVPGIYHIEMSCHCPYVSSRESGVAFTVPYAVRNTLEFTVPGDVSITVEPSVSSVTKRADGKSVIKSSLPATTHLSVQWQQLASVTDVLDTPDGEVAEVPVVKEEIVNVEQYTSHSIGDGVLRSSSELTYTMLHGSRDCLEIVLGDDDSRILGVDGEAMKKWDVVTVPNLAQYFAQKKKKRKEEKKEQREADLFADEEQREMSDEEEEEEEEAVLEGMPGKVLKVWLEYGMENTYHLTVESEKEIVVTSARITIPKFYCAAVDREKGYLSVVAHTSVEVNESRAAGVARVSASELPASMAGDCLLAYKFLQAPSTDVQISIEKHEDVEVLVATVDKAHLIAVLSSSRAMYTMHMIVRNTQSQFLRMTLPDDSTVWSAEVAGAAVKPAVDAEAKVMIPLQKSRQVAGSGQEESFKVSVTYVRSLVDDNGGKMEGTGRLTVPLAPAIDLPINHLFISLYRPVNFSCSDFSGDLEPVLGFSQDLPSDLAANSRTSPPGGFVPPSFNVSNFSSNCMPQVQQQQMQMPMQQMQQQMQVPNIMPMPNVMQMPNVMPMLNQMDNLLDAKLRPSSVEQTAVTQGIIPVKVGVPVVGAIHRFERLVVTGEAFEVSFRYEEKSVGFFARRRLGLFWLQSLGRLALVAVAVLLVLFAALI